MKTYSEKLKDPRWQRRRLEVMQAAGFACESCGDNKSQLHVHHPYYIKGAEPWEHSDLVCLCERCHREITAGQRSVSSAYARMSPESRAGFESAMHWFLACGAASKRDAIDALTHDAVVKVLLSRCMFDFPEAMRAADAVIQELDGGAS